MKSINTHAMGVLSCAIALLLGLAVPALAGPPPGPSFAQAVSLPWAGTGFGFTTAPTAAQVAAAIGTLSPSANNNFTGNNSFSLPINSTSNAILNQNGAAVLSLIPAGSTILGISAGTNIPSTDTEDTAVGYDALHVGNPPSTTLEDTAVGWHSQYAVTTGQFDTSLGVNSMGLETTGTNDTAIGTDSQRDTTLSSANVSIGNTTMRDGTFSNSIAVGSGALGSFGNTSAIINNTIAIGASALSSTAITSVGNDVVIGYSAGKAMTAANNDLALGFESAFNLTTGGSDTFLGNNAGFSATTAGNDLFVGYDAGYGVTTGASNIVLGIFPDSTSQAGLTTGNSNIIIGNKAMIASPGGSNQLSIGNLIYGSGMTGTDTTSAGHVGIGIAAPGSKLTVQGDDQLPTSYSFSDTDSTAKSLFSVDDAGDVRIGPAATALSGTAVAGFLYLPFTGAAPTGTPTDTSPSITYDRGTHTINVYDGTGYYHLTLTNGAG